MDEDRADESQKQSALDLSGLSAAYQAAQEDEVLFWAKSTEEMLARGFGDMENQSQSQDYSKVLSSAKYEPPGSSEDEDSFFRSNPSLIHEPVANVPEVHEPEPEDDLSSTGPDDDLSSAGPDDDLSSAGPDDRMNRNNRVLTSDPDDYPDNRSLAADEDGKKEKIDPGANSTKDNGDDRLTQASKVLHFLAPQLNTTVSDLVLKANEFQRNYPSKLFRSRKRLHAILDKIKSSRKGRRNKSLHATLTEASAASVKPTFLSERPQSRKRKNKLSKNKLKKGGDTLEQIISKKLEYENTISQLVEPILSKEPTYLLDEKLQEYTSVAGHIPNIGLKLRPDFNYCRDLHILDFGEYEANDRSVIKALWDAMLFLKKFIGADDARIYHAKGDCIARFVDEQCHRHPTNWPIGPGTIAAAYAAHKGQILCLDADEFISEEHPLGLAKTGEQPVKTAILPMLTPNKRVLAVMEFDKNSGDGFKMENIHYALSYGSWITAALIRKGIKESLRDAKQYNATILNCLKCFLHEKLTLNQCISAIMIKMKDFVNAERVIFYHMKADKKLDADVYEDCGSNQNVVTKSSRKIDIRKDLLMKEVAENHVVVNIHKAEGNADFIKYHIFDKSINSILCVPIGNPKRLLGIIKVWNKVGHKMFFDIDLVNVSNAGIYCTSIIFYSQIGKQLDNTILIANKQKATLTNHMVPCPHDILQFRSRPITKPPPYYLSFDWYPSKDELARDLLADYAWWMFNDLFEGDAFMDKFDIFLLMCKKGYRRSSSYHNFEHAFCATHCMFVIVRTCSQKFSYLEQMALMCAMLCHDIDHPGKTNPFLKASEHPLSKLYKFAFLENHHSNVTRILIDHCKIFEHLSPTDYKAMVEDMHRLIIATDLAKHFRKKKYLDDLVKEKHFDDTLPAHKMHLKSIIMTTCDLSGQFKSFERTREITFTLYIELYREGDWLKSKGLPVHSTLDRYRYLDIPQDQVNFLSMVVIPCVLLLVQMVPVLKDPYVLSCNNLEIWKRVVFIKLFR